MKKVTDINISSKTLLPSPLALCEEIEKTEAAGKFVAESREAINKIIFGDDRRLLIVVGPCSIHDLEAGREYAHKLAALAEEVKDRMLLVMRVYFEKPRTTVGWKGLIMDPNLDGTSDIPEGLRITQPALTLAQENKLDLSQFPIGPMVTESIVRNKLAGSQAKSTQSVEGPFDPTAIIVYAFTGEFALAITVGFLEVFAKMGLYFFHERLWQKIRFGKKEIPSFVLWFTGLPASGKKAVADCVYQELRKEQLKVERLDSHDVRPLFPETGFTPGEVNRHVKRAGHLCAMLEKNGVIVVASFVSPYACACLANAFRNSCEIG